MANRPRRPAGSRAHLVTTTVSAALEGGTTDVSDLKSEIEDWKDNLEGNNMEHLPKFEEVQECFDVLESGVDALENLEVPDCLSDLSVSLTIDTRQSAQSRSGRMSNAVAHLYAAKEAGEAWVDENPELEVMDDADAIEDGEAKVTQDDVDDRAELRSTVETFVDELDTAISDLEGASFPGMY
jgi:hypothetical protein